MMQSHGRADRHFISMQAYEIFSKLSPEGRAAVFQGLYETNRSTYRGAMQVLATRRKLRPVFLEKKPRPERDQWMADMMARPAQSDLAIETLQSWLLTCRKEMILAFLGHLGLEHDGNGLIEDLPPEPSPGKVREAVASLLEKFPSYEVAAYLNLFVEMDPEHWPTLVTLLAEEPALRFETVTT